MKFKTGAYIIIKEGTYRAELAEIKQIKDDLVEVELKEEHKGQHTTISIKDCIPANSRICIFEKRICEYAYNVNGSFQCECPTDEEMLCR